MFTPPRTLIFAICLTLLAKAYSALPNEAWFPKAKSLEKPSGRAIRVTTVDELFQAANDVKAEGTISIADGHYMMPRYFAITTDNVTLRGESGDRHKVIIDGARSRHGELIGITKATGVTIADLTIQNIKWNGIKINSNLGADKVTIHNCVIHNIWQRGIKAPAMPKAQGERGPRDCRVQFCLFYNDRAKQFADDETDTAESFNGNCIGGIDVKKHDQLDDQRQRVHWDSWSNAPKVGDAFTFPRTAVDARSSEMPSSIATSPLRWAIRLLVIRHCRPSTALRETIWVSQCPETGILACYTRGCRIQNNTIYDPQSKLKRLVWVQKSNDGLRVQDNLLIGSPILNSGESSIETSDNLVFEDLATALVKSAGKTGQHVFADSVVAQAIELPKQIQSQKEKASAARLRPGQQTPEAIAAMRKTHAGFKGQRGYVAQLGDSITYSMAFWSPIGWDGPERYLTQNDDLPKQPCKPALGETM